MRKVKSFRLSEEAIEALDKLDNASQFIEKAILEGNPTPPWKNIEFELQEIKKILSPAVNITSTDQPVPDNSSPTDIPVELPECCTTLKKCQHWSFNELDEVWVHRLTGETREAD